MSTVPTTSTTAVTTTTTTAAPTGGSIVTATVTGVIPAPVEAPVAAVTVPSTASLVAEVEAAGIDPGPDWNWSNGDTATECGAIAAAGVATGCTFGPAGRAPTVFSGTPTLALVAHELANAETENDAVPRLMAQVSAAAAGTSWSPIDAVASCLVEHLLGFQDGAAGPWQCPVALATTVAANIHDSGPAVPPA